MAIVVDKDGNPINGNQLKPVKRIPLKNKQKEVRELSATEKVSYTTISTMSFKLAAWTNTTVVPVVAV